MGTELGDRQWRETSGSLGREDRPDLGSWELHGKLCSDGYGNPRAVVERTTLKPSEGSCDNAAAIDRPQKQIPVGLEASFFQSAIGYVGRSLPGRRS